MFILFRYLATEPSLGTLLDIVYGSYKGPYVGGINYALYQVCTGLKFMHSKGIFHHDLKPSNILISYPGGSDGPRMKLTNFGVYRISQDQNPLPLYKLGTHGWMAPEIYESFVFTAEMNLFSIGLIFAFSLCGGRHAFGSLEIDNVAANIKKKRNMTMSIKHLQLVGEIAEQMFNLIDSMLCTDPIYRPSLRDVLKHPFFQEIDIGNVIKIYFNCKNLNSFYIFINYRSTETGRNPGRIQSENTN